MEFYLLVFSYYDNQKATYKLMVLFSLSPIRSKKKENESWLFLIFTDFLSDLNQKAVLTWLKLDNPYLKGSVAS